MTHFTIQIGPGGPMLTAYVAVSEPRREALNKAGKPVPAAVSVQALVDTGASSTCIDPGVLAQLGLSPTGKVPCLSPTTGATAQDKDQYDVAIVIPPATPTHPPYLLQTLPVISSDLAAQGFQALIGRDILKDCLLTYNGDMGFFTLAF